MVHIDSIMNQSDDIMIENISANYIHQSIYLQAYLQIICMIFIFLNTQRRNDSNTMNCHIRINLGQYIVLLIITRSITSKNAPTIREPSAIKQLLTGYITDKLTIIFGEESIHFFQFQHIYTAT